MPIGIGFENTDHLPAHLLLGIVQIMLECA